MSNVKEVILENNGVIKEFSSLKKASSFLNSATTTIQERAKYGQKMLGWKIVVTYTSGCVDCGTKINRLDELCHECYIKDMDYTPTDTEQSIISLQTEIVQARII